MRSGAMPEFITQIPRLPDRPQDGHKGMFGRVLVVGGNKAMLGAPTLAGTSALRLGSGLVQIAVPRSILQHCLAITPELIGLGLGKASRQSELGDAAKRADSIVIGPGLGQTPSAEARLRVMIGFEKAMVVDADGLNLLSRHKRWQKHFKGQAVLTPHPGEMGRLAKLLDRTEVPADEGGRIDIATAAAEAFGQVVVLKGHRTVVTDGARVYINQTGD